MRLHHKLMLIAVVFGLVGCDHATKHWAKSALEAGSGLGVVPGVLDLQYTANPDTAFSLLGAIPPDVRLPIILLAQLLATVTVVVVGLVRSRRARGERGHRVELWGYALVVAGAAGNFLDRLFRGYVVDFIHLHHWPVFNVADVCIVAGVLLLVLVHWRRERAQPSAQPRGGPG